MKKILYVFFTLAVTFTFVGCSDILENSGFNSSETSVVSERKLTDENKENQVDSTKEATPVNKMITMNITVDNNTFSATLEDNNTTKALVKQLPLTLDMSELNGNEKYYYLPSNLRADTPSNPGTINEGDIMLYDNNCVVVFTKTFNTSYSYVKLGHVDNAVALSKALGSGNVKVTFSVS